ncbi:hypothetical protein E4U55_005990 [Claviceps digitariae]|nr:hypothetical protein E4U55_005990 [Claviceps digitariae]
MAGHDTARVPGHAESKAALSTPDTTRVTRPRPSLETERSSASGGSEQPVASGVPGPSPDANAGRRDHHHPQQQSQQQQQTGPSPTQTDDSATDSLQRGASTRRKRKPKSSGGFLLQNPFSGKLRPAARGSIRALFQTNGKTNGKASTQSHNPQSSRPNEGQSLVQSTTNPSDRISHDESSVSPKSRAGRSEGSGQEGGGSRGGSEEPMTRRLPRSPEDSAGDVDSTQIVQMALNLSESRRMASRRHVSRGTPPRLSPLPDGSSGSKLRQHLQQQRKSSLNGSPKTKQAPSPRIPSSGRLDSSAQLAASFEIAHDGPYRYQFSSSTLARAAKAKEHLELMAQYRRLLDVLPPLKAGFGPHLTASPPGSPVGNKPGRFGHGDNLPLGRQYNPLQFIRNRKVRARERKVIDGEKQGFGDVEFVKLWVDRVVERATSFATDPDDEEDGGCIMPKFPYAADETDDGVQQASMDPLSKVSTRVRRPRVDWFVEPCDITADAYWLEQDNHKELIEDRHWRKIFPPSATLSRPLSRETAVDFDAIPPLSMQDDDDPLNSQAPGIFKVDSGLSHNTVRDRAKQTLNNIRAFPHRHHAQNISPDFMWHKKDSTSDISGSDSDRRRKHPKTPSVGRQEAEGGASSSNMSRALTEEQISDMVAKDARRVDHVSGARSDPEPGQLVSSASRKLSERNPLSLPPSRFHSRKGSTADTSDSDRKPAIDTLVLGSPVYHVPGSQSLDVPDGSRKDFVGNDYSLPTSPELRPTRESTEAGVSARLSPTWTRSGSPHRNPISKFRQIMREKGGNHHKVAGDQDDYHRQEFVLEPSSPEKSDLPDDRKAMGVEPVRRGIFKAGPRLETAFRGGVSRLGDMLWKREGAGEQSTDVEITDESENEKDRGRSRPSLSLSRRPSKRRLDGQDQSKQQFLDITPLSRHSHSLSATPSKADLASSSTSHGQQQSSQVFDTVGRPRIEVRSASTSALVENTQIRAVGGSGTSDSTPHGSSGGATDGVGDADKRRDSPLQVSKPDDDVASSRSRHWSIADIQGTPTEDTRLTRREIARMRALVLSTGIKAMEICRRAQEAQKPFCPDAPLYKDAAAASGPLINWAEIAKLCPEAAQPSDERPGNHIQVAFYDLYAFAARSLSAAIQNSGRRWQASADHFTYRTSPQLQNRIGDVRSRIADDLSEQSRQASDLADETNRDLALGQPLKVKAVVDTIEKMLRRKRRRLRWVRRALWLTVEWLLVGFMWYVWAMVMILRVFLGIGKGVVKSVRWLLWL